MRRAVAILAAAGLCGCGAATEPLAGGRGSDDAGASIDGDASVASDSSPAVDSGITSMDSALTDAAPQEAGPPCDGDADYDAALCTPPADDLLVADPPVISVPAGSYGIAHFKATGPWASDPNLWVSFDSATVPMPGLPFVLPNMPPTAFLLQVSTTTTDQQGTITAVARDGNIERYASVTVQITGCVPWDYNKSCGGYQCGFQDDGCGGLVSCGTCPGSAPYCYLGECTAAQPTYCPIDQGLGSSGCIPCSSTRTCTEYCREARCTGLQDVCFCAPIDVPTCPLNQPTDGSECTSPGEECTYYNSCFDAIACRCEPSGLWTCPIVSCG